MDSDRTNEDVHTLSGTSGVQLDMLMQSDHNVVGAPRTCA